MTVWEDCIMEVFTSGESPSYKQVCEVRIVNDTIDVTYHTFKGVAVYEGREIEVGHFTLTCDRFKGRGTLHRFADGDNLEGFWAEGGQYGMWMIHLDGDVERTGAS